jgi:hypothetical protein
MGSDSLREIAVAAAQYIVDEGMDYASAKRKAARALGMTRANEMPANEMVEDEVRSHIAIFHADSQPAELAVLRRLALRWMERLAEFRPHLGGAAWRGTATRLSDLHIDLYCDDPKSAEIALINSGLRYELGEGAGPNRPPVLTLSVPCPEFGENVLVHLAMQDLDDLRGALKPDARRRTWRGDASALRQLLQEAGA